MSGGPRLHALFPTPVIEERPEALIGASAALRETILARRDAAPGGEVSRSNLNGWHSDSLMLEWGGEPARRLARAALEACAPFTHDMGARPGQPPRFEFGMEMWANVSPAGAANQMHAHPGAFWSAVFFVDDGGAKPGEGQLVLLDPRFPMNRLAAPDVALGEKPPSGAPLSQHLIECEPGKLVAFPSWLMHAVRPHTGEGVRVSVAMNILVRQVAA